MAAADPVYAGASRDVPAVGLRPLDDAAQALGSVGMHAEGRHVASLRDAVVVHPA